VSNVPGEASDREDWRVVEAGRRVGSLRGPRGIALAGAATLVFAFGFALFRIIDVVGDPTSFFLLVAGSLLAATLFSRVVRARTAVLVGLVLLTAGLGFYLLSLPADVLAAQDQIVSDIVAMLTGLSVLRLQKIGLWALGFTPAPVFLTWYFAMRGHYVAAATAGGSALSLFVLTGDVGLVVTLIGVVGAIATVGFGRLDRYDGREGATEALIVVLAAVIVLTVTVSVVPGGSAQPINLLGSNDGQAETVEASLVNADQRLTVLGSIELSPEVRFSVEASTSDYWRVAGYDRYTGDGWVRTGSQAEYEGRLPGPEGSANSLTQQYEIQGAMSTMPAAWQPVSVSGNEADEALVTDEGGFQPEDPLEAGDTYEVRSLHPGASPTDLERAGTDYPTEIERRYTQLPASTPSRVERRTAVITERAGNPYEMAVVVEQWLENNREYSLDVERPEGNIADAFLFEMDRGYCTYYATTMVTMLRSQGVPARFVVGYTPGERVDEDRWVARGLDSHAWVEVYFPDEGWIRFDPTPAGPRNAAEQERIQSARSNNESGVDTDETQGNGSAWTPTETETPEPITPTPDDDQTETTSGAPGSTNETPTPVGPAPGNLGGETTTTTPNGSSQGEDEGNGGLLPEPPSREEAAFGLVVLAGAIAGLRRAGVTDRAYRAVWLRWQPRADPTTDIDRAYRRLEYLLASRHRPRRDGETPRQYFTAVDADERAERVRELYERARYGGTATERDADEAVEVVDGVTRGR